MMRRAVRLVVVVAGLGVALACSSQDRESASAPAGSGATAQSAKAVVTPAVVERGRELYKKNCAACHGESGKGDGPGAGVLKPPPRDHTDPAYMSTLSDKEIADIIKMGGAIKGKPLMPSHPQFKEADLQALVAFVRSLSEPAN